MKEPMTNASSPGATGQTLTNQSSRQFYRIAIIGSAIGFGFLGATLQALEASKVGFTFSVSYKTVLAFLAGFGVTCVYWRVMIKAPRYGRWASMIMGLAGVVMFLYPIKFVPRDKIPDIGIGLVIAAVALSGAGALIYFSGKFLGADDAAEKKRVDGLEEKLKDAAEQGSLKPPFEPFKSGK